MGRGTLRYLSRPYQASHLLGSAPWSVEALLNGPSNSARRRETRPHPLSEYGSRASAQVACRRSILAPGKVERASSAGSFLAVRDPNLRISRRSDLLLSSPGREVRARLVEHLSCSVDTRNGDHTSCLARCGRRASSRLTRPVGDQSDYRSVEKNEESCRGHY
jgi:hypothetical protein